MAELTGKSALVLGDDEIGVGIATRLRRAGADVQLVARHTKGTPISAHILIANTLEAPRLGALDTQTDDDFIAALSAVTHAANAMRAALPFMRERAHGRIILVGHRYGETVTEGIGPYNAAASALIGLARTAAVDWGRHGVTTNVLLPFADTQELRAARLKRQGIIDLFLSQTPLKRAGDPVDDIGGAALYLASDDAGFVNGQVVHADGGQHIAGPVLNPIKFA